MKYIKTLAIVFSLATIVACKSDKKEVKTETPTQPTEAVVKEQKTTPKTNTTNTNNNSSNLKSDLSAKKIVVMMSPKNKSAVDGQAVFREENGTVNMTSIFSGLKPGKYSLLFNDKADCSSENADSSGKIWNTASKLSNDLEKNTGYVSTFTANEKGRASVAVASDKWCIGCGDSQKDILGKALVVKEGTLDVNNPTSGKILSCAEVTQ